MTTIYALSLENHAATSWKFRVLCIYVRTKRVYGNITITYVGLLPTLVATIAQP